MRVSTGVMGSMGIREFSLAASVQVGTATE
jgi:hypothetical protein